jgi:hypothetical protein
LLKFERAEGRIQVTNKRVIFRAAGRSIAGRTTLQHEFAIDEIAGIEAQNNFKFSFLYVVFAALIMALASFVIYGPSAVSKIAQPVKTRSARIYGIMFPKHLQRAYDRESEAQFQIGQAEKKLAEASAPIEYLIAQEAETAVTAKEGIVKTRRVLNRCRWGNTWYTNQQYRDMSPEGLQEAQALLDAATVAREEAEAEQQNAATELGAARKDYERAVKAGFLR